MRRFGYPPMQRIPEGRTGGLGKASRVVATGSCQADQEETLAHSTGTEVAFYLQEAPMGPIHRRNPSSSTTAMSWKSTLWKSTCLALLLAGCQGPRPVDAPVDTPSPTPEAVPAATPPATDRVQSVAEADGAVQVILPPRPDLHPGDALHIRDGERLIATALVTGSDAQLTRARVIALTDQRRPVRPEDRFDLVPPDPTPAPAFVEAPQPTETAPTAEPAVAAVTAVTTTTVEHLPAEPASGSPPPEVHAEHPHAEAMHTDPVHADPAVIAGTAAAVAVTAAEPAPPALQPEVRARLEAERAYWELAARVLRLPAGGPELAALQQRLRSEITAQGANP